MAFEAEYQQVRSMPAMSSRGTHGSRSVIVPTASETAAISLTAGIGSRNSGFSPPTTSAVVAKT